MRISNGMALCLTATWPSGCTVCPSPTCFEAACDKVTIDFSSVGGEPIHADGLVRAASSTGPRSAAAGSVGGEGPQDTSKSSDALNRNRDTVPLPRICQGAGPSRIKSKEIPISVSPNTCTATPAEQWMENANVGSHWKSASN